MLLQTTCDIKSSNLVVSGEFLVDMLFMVYAFAMVLSKVEILTVTVSYELLVGNQILVLSRR